jgi:hypothetical protein
MKKVFVSSLIKTRRLKRLQTVEYFLKRKDENLRVCKKMFLSTVAELKFRALLSMS